MMVRETMSIDAPSQDSFEGKSPNLTVPGSRVGVCMGTKHIGCMCPRKICENTCGRSLKSYCLSRAPRQVLFTGRCLTRKTQAPLLTDKKSLPYRACAKAPTALFWVG
jgi:hypothetical protein